MVLGIPGQFEMKQILLINFTISKKQTAQSNAANS
jgi:hypothetical protein